MKIFLDGADTGELKEALSWGLIDGVTTNPSLLAKTGRPYAEVLREVCALIDGPVSAEVVSCSAPEMLEEGEKLARLHPNIVVKCPVTPEGLKATRALVKRGVKVNVTLIFSPGQALMAGKCGATYLSLFVGRLDDVGQDGMAMVEQTMRIVRNYNFSAEVLVASLRNPLHVVRAAELGAHVATLPFNILRQMLNHPLTDIGLERFLADWHASKQKI
ncbi:MAG TPA: fructose-6-phosphate aldolase [Candidatus Binataceae bacterium]|jgi:transaldolase|nr:fructose-6-phosphate aldolase [Candidatus Binataceae bacterium]